MKQNLIHYLIYWKMKDSVVNNIQSQIEKGGEISPFLFLSSNTEVLDAEVESLALSLLNAHGISKTQLFTLPNDGESIKIKEMKLFLENAHRRASFQFQIFLIQDISRMTIKAANAALKFLEEPGEWNIVFLTNASEAGVLDTILSRVQSVPVWNHQSPEFRQDYCDLLSSYFSHKDTGIISHFFSEKLDKSDYIDFLKTLIYYTKKHPWSLTNAMLSELEEDINLVQRNNLLPKYVVDKYLLRI